MDTRVSRFVLVTAALILVLALPAFAGKGGNGGGGGKPGGGDPPPPADPQILFTTPGGIHVANEDGTNQTLVLDTGEAYHLHASYSPDAARIVFESSVNGQGIYVMDADGSNVQKLASTNNFNWAHPVWSPVRTPDGKSKIAFIDKVGTDFRAVFVMNTDGSDVRQLSFPDATRTGHWNVTWSPDATQIAVTADTTGDGPPEDVLVCDLGLGLNGVLEIVAITNLLSEGDNPGGSINDADYVSENIAWAKTSDRIAVGARLPGGIRTVYLIDLAAPQDPTPLTEGLNPSWAPDDGRIVFERVTRRGRRDLVVIDVDGANETTIVAGTKQFVPHTPVWRR